MKKIIIFLLLVGIFFRLFLSSNGNFIFNIDNARDAVDVREMVVLKKPRLIGPTSAIEGVFNGPAWYYLLSIPFLLSGGNPYASILMEILLWAIGGYFLLLLANKFYGKLASLTVDFIWIASNYILLASQYAFNPNPILFLMPVFIYSLLKYLETKKEIFNILSWFLAGAFLQFEIAVGIFMPVIIILSLIFSDKRKFFKDKYFYLGPLIFLVTLLPQLFFELRHNFFITRSFFEYKSITHGGTGVNLAAKTVSVGKSFYDSFLPTLMNFEFFTKLIVVSFFVVLFRAVKQKNIDQLTKILLLILFVPILGFIPLRVDPMRWHFNSAIIAAILLIGWIIQKISKWSIAGFLLACAMVISIVGFSVKNVSDYIQDAQKGDQGNSILKNELSAIDYCYKNSGGKNFKAYSYIPSVIDYPYQYLFWWYGAKKYGFLPEDYAYLPNKPPYISGKEQLQRGTSPQSSALICLIKEPDQIGQRHLWENSFKKLPLISSDKIGSIDLEIRREF